MARFNASYSGIGEMLNSDMIQRAMAIRGEKVKARAESIAPDATPLGEGYKYEFALEVGEHGGEKKDRAFARVKNTSPHAIFVEFGNGTEKGVKHRTLGRALDAAKE